ncbi:DEAD/DEAH box helicase [Pseudomonas sp. gcc21]|uniref:DEAD/DEAH box helicase n=1 Tax=Pseudomonas sp. gcc21 TaxID=2726989 RepID=UPI0014518650|nr:DEAD/DEAH box helicase [Pseudomonas sp. gcc21]QJD59971.1 DEAD/DEAH box helicase [Pseudomonas sp. gcc21]
MPDYPFLPPRFSEIGIPLPEGLNLSDRILDAEVILDRDESRITASLVGIRTIRGVRRLIAAPSIDHDWVVDGATVRPLPNDAPNALRDLIGSSDPNDLAYSEAIAILNSSNDFLPVTTTEQFRVAGLAAAEGLGESVAIPDLKAELYPYQAKGVLWMNKTINREGGLILADEMGLGKTLQIIALLLLDPPPCASPALVLCPTSLITNWSREIMRFAPTLSFMIHRGAHRTGVYKGLQQANVVITTYETMVNDIAIFSAFEWSWVICDEAQAIKNPDSNRRQAVASIPRKRTIPMTGTPVENTLLDLWSLVDFAIPGLLGARSTFEIKYPDTLDAAKELGVITDPVILKRRVADVADDLPERIDIDLPVELDSALAHHYRNVRAETLARYPVAGALVATLQLQLVCAHPWLRQTDPEDQDGEFSEVVIASHLPLMTPKMERTVSLLREAFTNGKKVLVFSIFNRIGDLIKEAASDLPAAYWGAINGSTEQKERQNVIDEFSVYEGPGCLILNPKAAGAGLNITAATVVIHYTPVWNPAVEAQASARAHRRGQTMPVTIYRLYFEDTVERVMLDRSSWKQDLGNETLPLSTRNEHDLKKALNIEPECLE